MNNAAKKLKRLEKTFDLAAQTLAELPEQEGGELVVAEVCDVGECELAVVDTDSQTTPEDVFTLNSLKQDFTIVRQTLLKLINTGQTILTQVQLMDVGDMHPKHLEALAGLQNSVGSNLKLLIDIYEKIAKIEKMKGKGGPPEPDDVPEGGVKIDKAIVFTGSTKELLGMMDKKDE
jgi:hypothetical protein